MSHKMQVIFIKQTGHVLSAFTRTADIEGKPTIGTLTGNGLIIRNRKTASATPPTGGETLIAPPVAMDVAVVDYDPDVFRDPRTFVAGGGKVAKLGPTIPALADQTQAPPPPSPQPPVLPAASPPLVNFSKTRVTVQLNGDTTDDKGVCVLLQEAVPLPGDEPEHRIAQGAIKSGTHFVSLDLKTSPDGSNASIPDKDFYVLALVAGYQPLFGKRLPAP